MAESVFARRLLEKQGWKEGDGLGKKRDGISKPIKVSLKVGKAGVGHDPGTEFKDHWWLKVFNEAASSISATKEVKTPEVTESQKPQIVYKGFVKCSTLSNGKEEKDSDCSSDDEEQNTQDSFSVPTLDDIHKYCGGATGHRAATLGIKMQGKLHRAAEQERLFNERRNNKTEPVDESVNGDSVKLASKEKKKRKKSKPKEPVLELETTEEKLLTSLEGRLSEENCRKKRKLQNLKENEDCDGSGLLDDNSIISNNRQDEVEETEKQRKKGKKKKKHKMEEDQNINELPTECSEHTVSLKKKKKSKHREHKNCEIKDDCEFTDTTDEPKQKKKKKKHKH